MTKGSSQRASKYDSEKHIFNRELSTHLHVSGFDQFVILYQLNSEPRPGHRWSIMASENLGAIKFTDALKIFIATENYEKYAPLKKIYLYNQNVTYIFLNGLNRTLEKFSSITHLRLKNCNLTNTEIESLYSLLKTHPNVVNLNLDQNPISEQIYGRLLYDTNLKFLSLQQCKINEKGIKMLSKYMICNRKLLVLDLSSNCIEDNAAGHLAAMLRQNRKLKSLLLTDNWITDVGCKSIMQALQKFALNKDETYVKRQLAFKYYNQRKLLLQQMKPSTARVLSPKSATHGSKQSKRYSRAHKQAKKSKLQSQKIQYATIKHLTKEPNYENDKQIQDYLDANVPKSSHPFTSNITLENDNIYCPGNMVLIFLSLAYNKLTKLAYMYMIEALQYQLSQTVTSRLMYIIINGNYDLTSTEATDVEILLEEQQSKISSRSEESINNRGQLSL